MEFQSESHACQKNYFDFGNQNRKLILPQVTCCKSGGRKVNEANLNNDLILP